MPTTVRFASDGRAFVAEKRGIIKAYDSVDDASATQVLDIRTVVHDFWDRGLLSIALDPDFSAAARTSTSTTTTTRRRVRRRPS